MRGEGTRKISRVNYLLAREFGGCSIRSPYFAEERNGGRAREPGTRPRLRPGRKKFAHALATYSRALYRGRPDRKEAD